MYFISVLGRIYVHKTKTCGRKYESLTEFVRDVRVSKIKITDHEM